MSVANFLMWVKKSVKNGDYFNLFPGKLGVPACPAGAHQGGETQVQQN